MPLQTRPGTRARLVVAAASAATVVLGLSFIFVRAPHPWGWEGFDHYHELGLMLARGESFPTIDYPWGYAYFLAAFYRLVGDRPWVPLIAQALLNGLVPPMLYALVRRDLGERVAIASAVVASVLSFNTIYASTQSSDSVCTVVFLAGLVALRDGLATGRTSRFAAGGALAGLASQFRPNLVLFPAAVAASAWLFDRGVRARIRPLVIYIAMAAAVSVPWIVRNFRLTGELIPTSTHGGVQLWYGSLQTGPYLTSRAYNPRSVFEAAAFDYSSLENRPLVATAAPSRCASATSVVRLVYWTDRDSVKHTIDSGPRDRSGHYVFEIPGQPIPTAVYYAFVETSGGAAGPATTPAAPDAAPFVFLVDDRHLADMDRHGDLVSAFSFIHLVRALAWHEPMALANRFDIDKDGVTGERDLQLMARAMANARTERGTAGVDLVAAIDAHADRADVRFVDGSHLSIPHDWNGRITDVVPDGPIARQMLVSYTRVASLPDPPATDWGPDPCRQVIDVRVNDVFYRQEPHLMRRYTALAFDNIRRDPLAFARACVFRALRLFIVNGTSDSWTTQQFEGSRPVYVAAGIVSASYLLVAIAGVIVTVRRRARVWLLLVPIVYVPITISYVLTNMRYSVTIQPLLFAFAAAAVTAAADRVRRAPGGEDVEAARS
jgi:Dolichyl-phosphate-mannose-protein mannosyltransferase